MNMIKIEAKEALEVTNSQKLSQKQKKIKLFNVRRRHYNNYYRYYRKCK